MVHVADMAAAVGFYEALGAAVEHGSRDGDFVMMRIGACPLQPPRPPPNPDQNEGQVERTSRPSSSSIPSKHGCEPRT